MIPQTGRRCKPFLAKKRPGGEKAPWRLVPDRACGKRPAMQTPSGNFSPVVWPAGAAFMQPAGWAPQGGAAGAVGRAEPGQARPEGGSLRGRSRRLHKTGVGAAAGASPLPAGIQKIKAGAVPLLPGPAQCRRWPADFWCAGGDHWAPCRAGRARPPPRGPPSWKGS